MSDDLLHQRHAAYHTPRDALFALVKAATGQDAVRYEPVVQGYDNEVYQVTTDTASAYIVRIQQHGGASFQTEAWAMSRCRAVGVPVPEVILISSIRVDDRDKAVMVQQRLPGLALRDILPQLTRSEAAQIWFQAGTLLARIHTISVDGYGFAAPDSPGHWECDTWPELIQSTRASHTFISSQLRHWGFAGHDLVTISSMLDTYGRDFRVDHPVLCHGDFIPKHLFVDTTLRLTGIIDFGDVQGGPAIHDLAYLHMWRPEIDLGWLRSGYGRAACIDDRFEQRLVLHIVCVQLRYLEYFLRAGAPDDATALATRLQETLQRWRTLRDT
jgi:aminoglycoside phosphotransferase (APT) family kinase protein